MIKFSWYSFKDLSLTQLYTILAMRSSVFIVEQKCVYQDVDGKDPQAIHLMGIDEGELAAYLRIFPPKTQDDAVVFGRVLTAKKFRTKGYGKLLLQTFLEYADKNYPQNPIKCSAQYYLEKFYQSFGFVSEGEVYQEDHIPHITMRLTKG